MTIEEAIAHAQETADTRTDLCNECRQEHAQLAEWLTELKRLREENAELKRLLKTAVEDIKKHSFCGMCENSNDNSKCRKCKAITLDMFRWKHADEAEKLLKGGE